MTDKTGSASGGGLAARISECVQAADGLGLHVVAAHLDAALNALRGSGAGLADGPNGLGRPLH